MRALFAKLMVPVSMVSLSAVSFAQSSGSSSPALPSAPEINPGLLSAGLVLLVGGSLILLSRRRARLAAENE